MLMATASSSYVSAQDYVAEDTTAIVESIAGDSITTAEEIAEDVAAIATEPEKSQSFHQILKKIY